MKARSVTTYIGEVQFNCGCSLEIIFDVVEDITYTGPEYHIVELILHPCDDHVSYIQDNYVEIDETKLNEIVIESHYTSLEEFLQELVENEVIELSYDFDLVV